MYIQTAGTQHETEFDVFPAESAAEQLVEVGTETRQAFQRESGAESRATHDRFYILKKGGDDQKGDEA